jgi:hypothetical protein
VKRVTVVLPVLVAGSAVSLPHKIDLLISHSPFVVLFSLSAHHIFLLSLNLWLRVP